MDGLLTRTLQILWADQDGNTWEQDIDQLPYDRLPASTDHDTVVRWLDRLSVETYEGERVYGEALAYRRWDPVAAGWGSWTSVGEDECDGFDPWVEAAAS